MNDFDALLARVAGQARALGLPVSRRIDPHVAVNRRAYSFHRAPWLRQPGQVWSTSWARVWRQAPSGAVSSRSDSSMV